MGAPQRPELPFPIITGVIKSSPKSPTVEIAGVNERLRISSDAESHPRNIQSLSLPNSFDDKDKISERSTIGTGGTKPSKVSSRPASASHNERESQVITHHMSS